MISFAVKKFISLNIDISTPMVGYIHNFTNSKLVVLRLNTDRMLIRRSYAKVTHVTIKIVTTSSFCPLSTLSPITNLKVNSKQASDRCAYIVSEIQQFNFSSNL
jgi:hypothetical protein